MRFVDKIRNFIYMSESDEDFTEDDYAEDEEEAYEEPAKSQSDNIIDFSKPQQPQKTQKKDATLPRKPESCVNIQKLDRFDPMTIREVADIICSGQIVLVDISGADKANEKRIKDFLSGVSYGKNGTLPSVVSGCYAFTPSNVSVKDLEKSDFDNLLDSDSIFNFLK